MPQTPVMEGIGHPSLQAPQEVQQALVPLLWLVQVAGMACPLHQQHLVIGQVLQVVQTHFPQLGILVPIHDQRGNLVENGWDQT